MSHEKKMKDLMARLVAMSPEPPPYPDEAPMASRREAKRMRPALVFATAAALVVVLAVPLLLFRGGGEPDPAATTTTTAPPTTTTTDGSTDSTQVAMPIWSRPVYLYQIPVGSNVGNPALVPVWIEVTDSTGVLSPDDEFTVPLAALGENLPEGLENAIPAEVQIMELTTTVIGGSDVWVADMNEAFLDGAGGTLADFTMLNQLVYTLTDNAIHSVLFTVNGEPVTAFGGNGLDLSDPLDRETYLDLDNLQLHLINLTSAVLQQDDGSFLVRGIANVFEGSLMIRVLDSSGEAVHEEPVQATCGTGCWGEFSVAIAGDLIVPGESSIQLFTYSAEDGSMVDVITVPIPEGDVWEYTVGG